MNVIDFKMLSMMFFRKVVPTFRHHAHAATTRRLTILFALVVRFWSFAAFGRRGRPDGTKDTFAPALRPIPLLGNRTFADCLRPLPKMPVP